MNMFEPKRNVLEIENYCVIYDAFWDYDKKGVLTVDDIEIRTIEDVSSCEYIYSDGETDIEKTDIISNAEWSKIYQLAKTDAKKHDDITEVDDGVFSGVPGFMVTSFD